MNPLGHPDDARASSTSSTAWTDEDLAAVTAAFRAGDLPTEVQCAGGLVLVCVDEVVGYGCASGKSGGMQQMLRDLVLAGRNHDPVQISDPKDPAAQVQHTTVGALAAVMPGSDRG